MQLASAQAQLQALSRSNTLLGATLVQVVPLDAVEAAVNSAALAASSVPFTAQQQGLVSSSQHAQPVSSQQSFPIDTSGATLKLRGLPYSADESDVIAFFEGLITTAIPHTSLMFQPLMILCLAVVQSACLLSAYTYLCLVSLPCTTCIVIQTPVAFQGLRWDLMMSTLKLEVTTQASAQVLELLMCNFPAPKRQREQGTAGISR